MTTTKETSGNEGKKRGGNKQHPTSNNKPGSEPWKPKTPAEVPGRDPEKEPWSPGREDEPQKPEVDEPGKPETEPGPEPYKKDPPDIKKEPEGEDDDSWSPGREVPGPETPDKPASPDPDKK